MSDGTGAPYGSWSIWQRARRTRDEMAAIRAAITDVLKIDRPQTVRQVFYQLVARRVIEKTESEYKRTVIRLLSEMRLDDQIPWDWIVDESRRTIQTETFDSVRDALRHTAQYYRRSALRDCDDYIEIWTEKEALSGIIWDVASDYDVPVVVSKGMPSLRQVYTSFTNIRRVSAAGKVSYLYQFGDHDPTGCLIPKTIEARLEKFCDKYGCRVPVVKRIALTQSRFKTIDCQHGPRSVTTTPTPTSSLAIALSLMLCPAANYAISFVDVLSGISINMLWRPCEQQRSLSVSL